MSQLRTIFKKIEEDFVQFHLDGERESNYELVFSPLSAGYSYDDFLFLNSNMASEDAHRYYDELLEFSQIVNTIPRRKFWTKSGDSRDYLFNPYRQILGGLRLLDTDGLKAEMLYYHPIFDQALRVIREEDRQTYQSFLNLNKKLSAEITSLKESLTEENRTVVDLEIQLKEDNLERIKEQWLQQGKKEKVETKILDIIKDEFKRFLLRLDDVKAQLETLRRDHVGKGETFYLTTCIPNNLSSGEGLEWKPVKIDKREITALLEKLKKEDFEEVVGESNLKDLEIEAASYELLFVDVTRAWFDPDILSSPFWDINLLNPEAISIPRYTCKLVFVRNVDVQLPERSETNNRIFRTAKMEHLGPFIVNAQQLQKNKNLRLNSINGGLKIDRKTVLNVSSGLNDRKNLSAESLNQLVAKKQNQFVKLAPKLRTTIPEEKRRKRPVRQIKEKKAASTLKHVIQPMFLKANIMVYRPVKINLSFIDAQSGSQIQVQKENITVKAQNKKVNIPLSNAPTGMVIGEFNQGSIYEIEVDVEGYQLFISTIKVTPAGNQKHLNMTYQLQREPSEEDVDSDTFQLIGVVTHKIGKYPNPILKADYL